MAKATRPVFWAGLVGVPLCAITAYAYYYWYQELGARGFGYIYNAMVLYVPFRRAQICLGLALVAGLLTFELTHKHLSRTWRYGYVIVLGFGAALFVVGWIVSAFAVTPYWHHP